MMEVLTAALSFPSVIFTVLLGFVVLFWSSVIVGGVDPNSLDPDVDVDADVDADHGGVDADHGDHGDADHVPSGGVISSILTYMNFGSVPVSMIFSFTVLFSWVSSMLLQLAAGPWMASLMPATAVAVLIFATSALGSMIATGLATRPLRGAFKIESRHAEQTIVDCVCTITTSKVTENFGQATYETSGAPLNLSVRSKQANKLVKGSKAVIIGYDPETNTYEVGDLEPEAPARESGRHANENEEKKRLKEVREALRRAGAK